MYWVQEVFVKRYWGYFLVKLLAIYPDIGRNFTKKALKTCQNLKLKKT